MSNPIPKEKQTAYERWELASFADTRVTESSASRAASAAAAAAAEAEEQARMERARKNKAERELETRVQSLVGDWVESWHAEARAEGHAAGMIEGRELAYAEGRIETGWETASIRQIAQAFGHEVADANEKMAQDVLNLALDLARAMIGSALQIKPELILPIVSDTIRKLPNVQQAASLFLHPEDAQIVREHLHEELEEFGWRIVEDAKLSRGGCRVDTPNNEIDASVEQRWKRISAALGQQSDWLA